MVGAEAPLRLGILGVARIAKPALIDAARAVPGLAVTTIASRSLDRAAAYAAKHAIPHAVGDYRAVIDDPEIDAVYIPLPNNLHAHWSIAALEAGKAVLCEKPLSMNKDEAATICAAVEQTGGIFVEAFHYRFHPFIQRIKALIAEGAIGAVCTLEVRAQVPGALIAADNIRKKPELGGGAAMDLGIYCVDTLRFLMDATPEVLSAEAIESDPQIDGTMSAALRFASGPTATLRASHIYPEPALDSVLIVEGEGGRLTATKHFLPQLGAELIVETAAGTVRETADPTSTYKFQAETFAKQARRQCAIATDARSGLENMKVIDALYHAAGLSPRGQ